MKTLLTMLLLVGTALAQDANVVELNSADAAQARTLYNVKLAADKAWDDFYATAKAKSGLTSDIVFSKDFRFVVPKMSYSAVSGSGILWNSGCPITTFSPANLTFDSLVVKAIAD